MSEFNYLNKKKEQKQRRIYTDSGFKLENADKMTAAVDNLLESHLKHFFRRLIWGASAGGQLHLT